jgi:hypothetical protein
MHNLLALEVINAPLMLRDAGKQNRLLKLLALYFVYRSI